MKNPMIDKIHQSCLNFHGTSPWKKRKKQMVFGLFTILCLIVFSESLIAHPVSFEGGTALMSEMSPVNQELSFVYSPKWWLGTGIVFDRNTERWKLTSLHFALLAKRWNLPEAQGNFYLFGGTGIL